MVKEIDLRKEDKEGFAIIDESQLNYLYGGRYASDQYLQVEGEDGKPKNVHKVTIELICDHDQFLALMRDSASKGTITVHLV